jgi:hypothetical protein
MSGVVWKSNSLWKLATGKYTLESGQSKETSNIWYTRGRKTKQNITQCVLDTTGTKRKQTIVLSSWNKEASGSAF